MNQTPLKTPTEFPKSSLGFLWENMKGRRALYLVGIVGTFVYNIMQLTVPYFSQQIVDNFLTGPEAAYNLLNHRDLLFRLIALMVGLTVVRVAVVYLDCMAYEHVSQEVLYRIRTVLYDKVERQDMHFYNTYRTGDLMTRMTGDLDAVRHMIAWVIRSIIESIALVGATVIFFLYMNWRLALMLIVTAPFLLVIILLFKARVAPMHAALRERFANMNTLAQENISGNRVVKAFAREEYEMARFDLCNADYRDTNEKTALTWLTFFPYMEGIADLLSVLLILAGGLFLILRPDLLTMGEYVAFSGLIWALANPMRQLGNVMNEFQRFAAASKKVMEIYYAEPQIKDLPDAYTPTERLSGKITFRNVSFQYADGKLPVLKNINLEIQSGETVAIMGETGCGKTSLIHLIPRFYEATEGEVLIDDRDVRSYTLHSLRKSIGLATQDVLLYSDTIDGNIAYGDSELSRREVEKYARYSAAAEFITRMPEGYDTVVGERGVGLSGGQKQRISLARALAVRPAILILDDTTSAVDMETEKRIQESLRQLDFPCTKIIIAQRISTTKAADRIFILKDGQIAESGTHEELLAKKGYYAELVSLQTGEAV